MFPSLLTKSIGNTAGDGEQAGNLVVMLDVYQWLILIPHALSFSKSSFPLAE